MSEQPISSYSHEEVSSESEVEEVTKEIDDILTQRNVVYELTDHGLNKNVHQALLGLGLSAHICGILVCVWHSIDTIMVIHLYGREQFYVESSIFLFGFPLYRSIPTVISYISSHFIKHAIVHKRYTDSNIYYAHTILLCSILAIILIAIFSPLTSQLSSFIDGGNYRIQQEFGTSAMLLSAILVPALSLFTHAVDPIMMIQGRHFLMYVKNIVLFLLSIVFLSLFNLFLYVHTQPNDPTRLLIYPLLAYCISGIIITIWMCLLLARVKLYGITYNANLNLRFKHLAPINFKIIGMLLLRSLPSIINLVVHSLTIVLIYRAYSVYYTDYEAMVNGKVALSIFLRGSTITTISAISFETVVSYFTQIAYYARRYNRARSITLWGALYATLLNLIICISIFFAAEPVLRNVILLPQAYLTDPNSSTLNSEEFYTEIVRYLKLSALFHAPSGLYSVVLGAMQGSNYGAGALTMTFVKSVTVLVSFLVLMFLQGAAGVYVLAFGFGEIVGFILAIVGLVLQVKRFSLFSRTDIMADPTISKITSTKEQQSSSRNRPCTRVIIKEKRGKVKRKTRQQEISNHDSASVINSERSLLYSNQREIYHSAIRTDIIESSNNTDSEEFEIGCASSTNNTPRRPATQAIRHNHNSVPAQIQLRPNSHISDEHIMQSDLLRNDNSHNVEIKENDNFIEKNGIYTQEKLQPELSELHDNHERREINETPVIHMHLLETGVSDD